MEEYKGIYGSGYKDDEGNLYLYMKEFLLVREKLGNEKYNVGIIDNPDGDAFHLSLLEGISLDAWRKFFCEILRGNFHLEKILSDAHLHKYYLC